MGSIDIRPGSSADKFTVIKTSSDGAHMEFLTRAALEERLEKEWWGTDPKFSPPPAVPPVRMNEADFSVDLQAKSGFWIIPGWPVLPEVRVVKTKVVLP